MALRVALLIQVNLLLKLQQLQLFLAAVFFQLGDHFGVLLALLQLLLQTSYRLLLRLILLFQLRYFHLILLSLHSSLLLDELQLGVQILTNQRLVCLVERHRYDYYVLRRRPNDALRHR